MRIKLLLLGALALSIGAGCAPQTAAIDPGPFDDQHVSVDTAKRFTKALIADDPAVLGGMVLRNVRVETVSRISSSGGWRVEESGQGLPALRSQFAAMRKRAATRPHADWPIVIHCDRDGTYVLCRFGIVGDYDQFFVTLNGMDPLVSNVKFQYGGR